MPLINVRCPKEVSENTMKSLSHAVAVTLGKPEKYVMVVSQKADTMIAGKKEDCAYLEVKSIGVLNGDVNKQLSKAICSVITADLGIPGNKIYIVFQVSAGDFWGYDSSTF